MLLQFSWKRAKFVEFALRLENVDQARWTCKPLIVFTLLHNCFLSVVYHHIWSETFGCMDDDYQTGHKLNYQGLPLKTLAANMVCWMILSLFINTLLCANQNNKTWVNKIETVFWDKIEKTRVITPNCPSSLCNEPWPALKQLGNFQDGLLPLLHLLCLTQDMLLLSLFSQKYMGKGKAGMLNSFNWTISTFQR